jgi:flagellar biosynthesis protein FlhF
MKVKKDLGPEAVILYTKTFRKGGLLGMFGKPMAEITAGIELNLMDDVSRRRAVAPAAPSPAPHVQPAPDIPSPLLSGSVDSQWGARKALQRELNEMKTTPAASLVSALRDPAAAPLLSEAYARLRKKLLRQEVEDFILQKMIQGMMADRIDPDRREETERWLRSFIERCVKTAPPPVFSGVPRVLAFVGPTGVGKTTTLAKLAARFSLVDRKKVVMVTADTYRIAATEQLKTYGRIMGVPVEVANAADEMTEILTRHREADVILLDTAGRSPSNEEQMAELKQFVFRSQPDETHLVLSATTKYVEMLRIIERFGSAVPLNRLIFTKLDETHFYGAFLNLMMNFQIPLSYCAIGQNVPDDLEVPEPAKLAATISQALVA